MNGKRPNNCEPAGEGLDPELAALFQEAETGSALPEAAPFVSTVMTHIQQARRFRLAYQVGSIIIGLVAAAFAAPYVAARTLATAEWLNQNIGGVDLTLTPVVYPLAAVVTWRIVRRALR